MTECMLDIETLGTGNKAVVTSIGAVTFDITKFETVQQIIDRGYLDVHINVEEQVRMGRKITGSTVLWWLQQSDKARSELFNGQPGSDSVKVALTRFYDYCKNNKVKNLWGNGNTFDNVIVRDLYEDAGKQYPVGFRNDMDFRTLKYLVGIKYPGWSIPYPKYDKNNEMVAHVGYMDAACQAYSAQRIWDKLANDSEVL